MAEPTPSEQPRLPRNVRRAQKGVNGAISKGDREFAKAEEKQREAAARLSEATEKARKKKKTDETRAERKAKKKLDEAQREISNVSSKARERLGDARERLGERYEEEAPRIKAAYDTAIRNRAKRPPMPQRAKPEPGPVYRVDPRTTTTPLEHQSDAQKRATEHVRAQPHPRTEYIDPDRADIKRLREELLDLDSDFDIPPARTARARPPSRADTPRSVDDLRPLETGRSSSPLDVSGTRGPADRVAPRLGPGDEDESDLAPWVPPDSPDDDEPRVVDALSRRLDELSGSDPFMWRSSTDPRDSSRGRTADRSGGRGPTDPSRGTDWTSLGTDTSDPLSPRPGPFPRIGDDPLEPESLSSREREEQALNAVETFVSRLSAEALTPDQRRDLREIVTSPTGSWEQVIAFIDPDYRSTPLARRREYARKSFVELCTNLGTPHSETALEETFRANRWEMVVQPFLEDQPGGWRTQDVFKFILGKADPDAYPEYWMRNPRESTLTIDEDLFNRYTEEARTRPFLLFDRTHSDRENRFWYAHPEAAPYSYVRVSLRTPPPESSDPRYRCAEAATDGDGGTGAIAAAIAETPEQQAIIYKNLAYRIIDLHEYSLTHGKALLSSWLGAQGNIFNDESSISAFERFDHEPPEYALPRRNREKLLAYSSFNTYSQDETIKLWRDRLRELGEVLARDRLQPHHLRWIEFLSHSVDVDRILRDMQADSTPAATGRGPGDDGTLRGPRPTPRPPVDVVPPADPGDRRPPEPRPARPPSDDRGSGGPGPEGFPPGADPDEENEPWWGESRPPARPTESPPRHRDSSARRDDDRAGRDEPPRTPTPPADTGPDLSATTDRPTEPAAPPSGDAPTDTGPVVETEAAVDDESADDTDDDTSSEAERLAAERDPVQQGYSLIANDGTLVIIAAVDDENVSIEGGERVPRRDIFTSYEPLWYGNTRTNSEVPQPLIRLLTSEENSPLPLADADRRQDIAGVVMDFMDGAENPALRANLALHFITWREGNPGLDVDTTDSGVTDYLATIRERIEEGNSSYDEDRLEPTAQTIFRFLEDEVDPRFNFAEENFDELDLSPLVNLIDRLDAIGEEEPTIQPLEVITNPEQIDAIMEQLESRRPLLSAPLSPTNPGSFNFPGHIDTTRAETIPYAHVHEVAIDPERGLLVTTGELNYHGRASGERALSIIGRSVHRFSNDSVSFDCTTIIAVDTSFTDHTQRYGRFTPRTEYRIRLTNGDQTQIVNLEQFLNEVAQGEWVADPEITPDETPAAAPTDGVASDTGDASATGAPTSSDRADATDGTDTIATDVTEETDGDGDRLDGGPAAFGVTPPPPATARAASTDETVTTTTPFELTARAENQASQPFVVTTNEEEIRTITSSPELPGRFPTAENPITTDNPGIFNPFIGVPLQAHADIFPYPYIQLAGVDHERGLVIVTNEQSFMQQYAGQQALTVIGPSVHRPTDDPSINFDCTRLTIKENNYQIVLRQGDTATEVPLGEFLAQVARGEWVPTSPREAATPGVTENAGGNTLDSLRERLSREVKHELTPLEITMLTNILTVYGPGSASTDYTNLLAEHLPQPNTIDLQGTSYAIARTGTASELDIAVLEGTDPNDIVVEFAPETNADPLPLQALLNEMQPRITNGTLRDMLATVNTSAEPEAEHFIADPPTDFEITDENRNDFIPQQQVPFLIENDSGGGPYASPIAASFAYNNWSVAVGENGELLAAHVAALRGKTNPPYALAEAADDYRSGFFALMKESAGTPEQQATLFRTVACAMLDILSHQPEGSQIMRDWLGAQGRLDESVALADLENNSLSSLDYFYRFDRGQNYENGEWTLLPREQRMLGYDNDGRYNEQLTLDLWQQRLAELPDIINSTEPIDTAIIGQVELFAHMIDVSAILKAIKENEKKKMTEPPQPQKNPEEN